MRNTEENMYLESIEDRWVYQVYPDMDSDKWVAHREPDGGWQLTKNNLSLDEALKVAEDWAETRANDPDSNPFGPFA
jgi:hypothetical protein